MCLLCGDLWMPFELPSEAKARTFVADAPEPDGVPSPPGPARSVDDGDPPVPAE
jgi:hypothetical protein